MPIRLSPTATSGSSAMLMDVHQRGNLRFPQSLPEFQRLFPDDAACAGYLEKARWSDGFVCPHCQAAGEPFRFANRPGVLRCRRCRRDTPLSSASTGGSSTPSVPCSASRATSPHRPTQSFTPEPGSTLHVGGVGNNRIGKRQSIPLPTSACRRNPPPQRGGFFIFRCEMAHSESYPQRESARTMSVN